MTAGTTSPTFVLFRLTAGLPQSYPFKLQSLTARATPRRAIAVSNAGNAGRVGDLDGHPPVSAGAMMSEANPELAVLMEGANDLNNIPADSTNVSPSSSAMEDMVRDATGIGAFAGLSRAPSRRNGPGAGQRRRPARNSTTAAES